MLVDVHGKQYHMETWHAEAHNAIENKKMRSHAFDLSSPIGGMRKVIVDELGELVTSPIDLGESLIIPQEDGSYQWKKKASEETDN